MDTDKRFIEQDLSGENYQGVLSKLHQALRPSSYLEVGVFTGHTLRYANCRTIAIDPQFCFDDIAIVREIINKECLLLFQMTSDAFFKKFSPKDMLSVPLDMAFLDGMHRCEYLLRDFMNTERHCKKNSVIAMHDCLPVETSMTARVPGREKPVMSHREGWWTGDVWRTSLLLKRRRPDLSMTILDAFPTGLVLVTNLNPSDSSISDNYKEFVDQMFSWDLSEIGIAEYFREMDVQPTHLMNHEDEITKRFWL